MGRRRAGQGDGKDGKGRGMIRERAG